MIVLGLPFSATEVDMREYFEQFGEVSFVQVIYVMNYYAAIYIVIVHVNR